MRGRDIAAVSVVWGQEKSYADSQEKGLYSRSGKYASCVNVQVIGASSIIGNGLMKPAARSSVEN